MPLHPIFTAQSWTCLSGASDPIAAVSVHNLRENGYSFIHDQVGAAIEAAGPALQQLPEQQQLDLLLHLTQTLSHLQTWRLQESVR